MKQQTPTALIIRSSLALALALAIWSPAQAQSAKPDEAKKMMEGKMKDGCQEMMQAKQKMMEEVKA
ncbi:MAG: hypothetical protein ABI273_08350 [Lacunisphaera sp.]